MACYSISCKIESPFKKYILKFHLHVWANIIFASSAMMARSVATSLAVCSSNGSTRRCCVVDCRVWRSVECFHHRWWTGRLPIIVWLHTFCVRSPICVSVADCWPASLALAAAIGRCRRACISCTAAVASLPSYLAVFLYTSIHNRKYDTFRIT